jgi:hypothetical protein
MISPVTSSSRSLDRSDGRRSSRLGGTSVDVSPTVGSAAAVVVPAAGAVVSELRPRVNGGGRCACAIRAEGCGRVGGGNAAASARADHELGGRAGREERRRPALCAPRSHDRAEGGVGVGLAVCALSPFSVRLDCRIWRSRCTMWSCSFICAGARARWCTFALALRHLLLLGLDDELSRLQLLLFLLLELLHNPPQL